MIKTIKVLPKTILLNLIKFYQAIPRRRHCVFYPSCSEYTRQALDCGGAAFGIKKGFLRILRCHPFQKNIYDPFHPL